ncbi:MAG: hypothetical protein RLZ14_703, partial [Actinomycetota bacterium]
MSEFVHATATELMSAFAAKRLSPLQHLEATIARIEQLEPQLNAVIDRRYDEARAEARASADRYANGAQLPLDGVPVAAKEEHPMVGRSWTQGSLAYADLVADHDHPIIERIQAAGGIIHIRTATPEFCCTPYCHSRAWGITRNPWNTRYSPGGSSGGTGAALAAGYAPVGTGSDIGGSIRIPASLSGVAGFKPPWQRVPALPPYNLDQYCHDGPMARTVADCALLEDVIAGSHWRDGASLPNPPKVAGAGADVRGLHIAVCVHLGDWPLDGVPVAAKEEHPMVGRSWTQGSLAYADLVADHDHPIIERIQAAGGIIHIRTATPEFCCTPYCHSRAWGITRNPWNTRYSPGGSSGGTGAALAAG